MIFRVITMNVFMLRYIRYYFMNTWNLSASYTVIVSISQQAEYLRDITRDVILFHSRVGLYIIY